MVNYCQKNEFAKKGSNNHKKSKKNFSMVTCSNPIVATSVIYELLGYKKRPFVRKKFVLPEG